MSFLYVPMFYTMHTRYKGLKGLFSFFVLSVYPLFVGYFFAMQGFITVKSFFTFISSFLIANIAYEIGYILNDSFSSKKETAPTNRLSETEIVICENNIQLILFTRLCIIFIFSIILFALDINLTIYLCLVLFLLVVYTIHNSVNSKIRYITNFLLVSLRYLLPLVVLLPKFSYLYLFMFLLVPAIKSLTYFFKKNFSLDEKKLDFIQLLYYFLMGFLTFVLFLFMNYSISYCFIFVSLLIYRLLILIARKK